MFANPPDLGSTHVVIKILDGFCSNLNQAYWVVVIKILDYFCSNLNQAYWVVVIKILDYFCSNLNQAYSRSMIQAMIFVTLMSCGGE